MTAPEAYAVCRSIAKREAKNFYWAFRVLPRHKSDAMCAVYAFMRRADDLADDETTPVEQRRLLMRRWVEAWRDARSSGGGDDAVFVALTDTQRRFNISDQLLEELVQGTTMDLEPQAIPGEVQTYRSFDDLYRYCYLVASVVGLVCIRIFGYKDARAELYAEETGIAFQLTNILRDVSEDVQRRRVYLPLEMMEEFGVTIDRLRVLASGDARVGESERSLLATMGIQAEKFYTAGNKLIPLLDRDSRAAMWVLLTIYHRLLARMAAREMDVFRERVSVSTSEKASILLRGALMAARNRVAG